GRLPATDSADYTDSIAFHLCNPRNLWMKIPWRGARATVTLLWHASPDVPPPRRVTMKHLFCWSVLVCVCAGPLARADEAANAKEDAKKMQGTWKPVSAELGGNPFPDEVLKTMKLVLTDGKYTVTDAKQTDTGTHKLS